MLHTCETSPPPPPQSQVTFQPQESICFHAHIHGSWCGIYVGAVARRHSCKHGSKGGARYLR